MSFKKEDFAICVGAVNVLLDNRVVLQGQIIHDREEDRKIEHCSPKINVEVESEVVFITLELTCDALFLKDNAELRIISPPLFEEGDRVRINVAEISAIGPSHGCPEEECEEDDEEDHNSYYDDRD
jgi:hypothetical protein